MGNVPPPVIVVKALAVAGMGSKDLRLVWCGVWGWDSMHGTLAGGRWGCGMGSKDLRLVGGGGAGVAA